MTGVAGTVEGGVRANPKVARHRLDDLRSGLRRIGFPSTALKGRRRGTMHDGLGVLAGQEDGRLHIAVPSGARIGTIATGNDASIKAGRRYSRTVSPGVVATATIAPISRGEP